MWRRLLWGGAAVAVLMLAMVRGKADDSRRPPPRRQPPAERTAQPAPVALAEPELTPPPPPADSDPALLAHYRAKIDNPRYAAHKSRDRVGGKLDDAPEEPTIRADLLRLARARRAPEDALRLDVPRLAATVLEVDGRLREEAWWHAVRVEIGSPFGAATDLLLWSDGKRLVVGVDARTERTDTGFDQLRLYYHVDADPAIANERVHLGRHADLMAIRETRLRWNGAPAASDDERWKNFPLHDWGVTRKAAGVSRLEGHRQYELALDLEEVGLDPTVAFPVYVEVESDPEVHGDGKFKRRRLLGELGSQAAPVWLAIDSHATAFAVEREAMAVESEPWPVATEPGRAGRSR